MNLRHALWAAALWTIAGTVAQAATSAYWRFEDLADGSLVPAGNNSVPDSSGNNNPLQTFDPTFTSPSYSSLVSPLPLRSGLPNTRSLDFGPGGDDAGLNDDIFTTADKSISAKLFNEVTVEVAFRMDSIGGFQAIIGKDGKPLGDAPGEDNSPIPPFKISIRGDDFPNAIPNQLFVEWIDGDATLNSDDHFLASGQTVVPNKWYHVAVTINATDASFYVAGETGPYQLLDHATGDYAGPSGNVIAAEPLGWTVGRGAYNNNPADWADAHIDEVRISDSVLAPNQFLFVAVPEPSSAILCVIGLLGLLGRRRK
ncbi:MAG TPA: LamG-like jellyroll fold domain-containing protein [Lacipirellulaceae bacterium]|nr:LamG-like jellyroll fold domain-containing protein [Lacipirellulaceae bacterium]